MKNLAFEYAAVKSQRQAIETATKLLNEVASQCTKAGVKLSDEIMVIRNALDSKDDHLFNVDADLHFEITQAMKADKKDL